MVAKTRFTEFYKTLVEKPGNAEHSAKFDRCVAEVQAKGDGKNAFAVCSAAMGDEAFKSVGADDPNFGKELEAFMRTLGIAGAGPIPHSELARQDLERSEKFQKAARYEVTINGMFRSLVTASSEEEAERKARKDFREHYPEQTVNSVEFGDVQMMKARVEKAGDKCYVIRMNGAEYMRYPEKKDAEEAMAYLTGQGMFAVMIEESVMDITGPTTTKAAVKKSVTFGNSKDRDIINMYHRGYSARDISSELGLDRMEVQEFMDDYKEDEEDKEKRAAKKGIIEQTGKQLDRVAAKAEDAEDTEEKMTLVDNIKAIQLKRQKATIQARAGEAKNKSFKQVWGSIIKVT